MTPQPLEAIPVPVPAPEVPPRPEMWVALAFNKVASHWYGFVYPSRDEAMKWFDAYDIARYIVHLPGETKPAPDHVAQARNMVPAPVPEGEVHAVAEVWEYEAARWVRLSNGEYWRDAEKDDGSTPWNREASGPTFKADMHKVLAYSERFHEIAAMFMAWKARNALDAHIASADATERECGPLRAQLDAEIDRTTELALKEAAATAERDAAIARVEEMTATVARLEGKLEAAAVKQQGFPDWFQRMVNDYYRETPAHRTGAGEERTERR